MTDCLSFLVVSWRILCSHWESLPWSEILPLKHVEVFNNAWSECGLAQYQYGDENSSTNNHSNGDDSVSLSTRAEDKEKNQDLERDSERRSIIARPIVPHTYSQISCNGATEIASLFTKQGEKGINQDSIVIIENFTSLEDTVFCGVFDGHGPHGHFVSRHVRETLPAVLQSCWYSYNEGCKSFVSSGDDSEDGSLSPKFFRQESMDLISAWKDCFVKAYEIMDYGLSISKSIDCLSSGTTAVSMVKLGNDLLLGNVGDSRAILGTVGEDGSLMAIQLTVDLKPDIPSEAERITRFNGRIRALRHEPSVKRVWLPHHNAPGLAMSRVLGDFCLKRYGVISEPEFTHRRLTENDMFVVLATDGVWDALSNEEVIEIVASAPNQSSAAEAVVNAANKAWKECYATSNVDDCGVVCLFLNQKISDSSQLE